MPGQTKSYEIDHVCDVLVIGGGPAGAWAGLSAARSGAKVIIVDKGYLGTSGVHAATGGSIYYTVPGDPEQRREQVSAHLPIAFGLADTAFIEAAYDEVYRCLSLMAKWGYYWPRNADGYELRQALGAPGTMYFLRQQLIAQGVTILDHHPAQQLLTADGAVAGAAGIHPRTGSDWRIRAGAVVLASGGCAFLSGAAGTRGQTGEGYLMAAEAGAGFSGMEFTSQYAPSPKGAAFTKTGMYEWGWSMWDDNGKPIRPGKLAAQAILETGKAWCILDKYDHDGRQNLRHRQPNTFIYFERMGIDPFTQPFEIELRLEGTVRAAGGIAVDDETATGVPGLFAAGDVTSRERLSGAAMSGAGPALAWTFSSGSWSGRAAARFARGIGSSGARPVSELGSIGLKPATPKGLYTGEVERIVKGEMLPLEKNFFRSGSGLEQSLQTLGDTWEAAKHGIGAWRDEKDQLSGRARLRAREAAGLIAAGRWIYAAALERTETRGIHRRIDFTAIDPAQAHHIAVTGLDRIEVQRTALASSLAREVLAS